MKNSPIHDAAALANATLAAQFANDGILVDRGGGYTHDAIYFANDTRFAETYFYEPLTTYALGWKDNNNLEATLQFLAPKVLVPRRFDYKKGSNTEEFLSETDDVRSIGADFKRVEFTGQDVTSKTVNKGLTTIVDLDNVVGTAWEQVRVAKLIRRCLRNEIRRAVALISASAVNTGKTWSSASDPDSDIRNELVTATDLTGLRPNRVVIGDSAWNTRKTQYRSQNNAGGYASASYTLDQLATELMVDQVLVSKERYQSAAAAKSQIVGAKVWAFYAQDDADTQDGSNLKRFVSLHDANQGGGEWQVYRQQLDSKRIAITVGYYSTLAAPFTTGIRQLTIS